MDNSSNVYHPGTDLGITVSNDMFRSRNIIELTVVKANKTGGLLNGFKFPSGFSQFK